MHKRIQGEAFTWQHFTRPSEADFAFIAKHFPLEECDDRLVRNGSDISRFHGHDGWFILALHVPSLATVHSEFERATIVLLCDKSTIITVADEELSSIEALMATLGRKRLPKHFHHGTSMDIVSWLLDIVLDNVDDAMAVIYQKILTAEAGLRRRRPERVTRELGSLRRDSLMLDLMVEPVETAVMQMLDARGLYRSARAESMLLQIRDRLRGEHRLLRHYEKIIAGLFGMHEAAISQRTNRTVQMLTAVSVLFMPATLVASYYGMNVAGLPWAHDIRMVTGVLALAVVIFLIFVYRIYKR